MKKPHRNTQPMTQADVSVELKRVSDREEQEKDSRRKACPKTNVERVTEFMEWGSPVRQMFIIDAITKIATRILEDEGAIRTAMAKNGSGAWVSPDAWIQCARDWKEQNPDYFTR